MTIRGMKVGPPNAAHYQTPNPKPIKAPTQQTNVSWWLGLDRDSFSAEVKRRHPDIANSDEGRKAQRIWK